MAQKQNTPPGVDLEKKQIKFDLIKSNLFRVISVDGFFGGIDPHGKIQIALFNERWPIPQQMVHNLKDGKVAGEILEERITRGAVVREVEVQAVMELAKARALREWLDQHITKLEEMQKTINKQKLPKRG